MTTYCRICQEETSSIYYDVKSCRACAEFFRRSILANRDYKCREEESRCEKNCDVRSCRRKRLNECLRAGMKPQSCNKKLRVYGKRKTPFVNPHIGPAPIPENTLISIYQEYLNLKTKWSKAEQELLCFMKVYSLNDDRIQNHFITTTTNITQIQRSLHPSTIDFAFKNFPRIRDLGSQVQTELLRQFIPTFTLLASAHRTNAQLPCDRLAEVEFITEHVAVDTQQIPQMLDDGGETENTRHKYGIIRDLLSPKSRRHVFIFKSLQPTEEEIAALIGLLFWNHVSIEIGAESEKVCASSCAEIFETLQQKYRERGIEHPLIRLGELMELQSAIQRRVEMFHKNMPMMYIYGVFESDNYFYNIICR